jgi:hypothetical protein
MASPSPAKSGSLTDEKVAGPIHDDALQTHGDPVPVVLEKPALRNMREIGQEKAWIFLRGREKHVAQDGLETYSGASGFVPAQLLG